MATYSVAISQTAGMTSANVNGGSSTSVYQPTSGWSLVRLAFISPNTGAVVSANRTARVQVFDDNTSTWKDLFVYGETTNTGAIGPGSIANFRCTVADNYGSNWSGYVVDGVPTDGAVSTGVGKDQNTIGAPFIRLFPNMRILMDATGGSGVSKLYYDFINYT